MPSYVGFWLLLLGFLSLTGCSDSSSLVSQKFEPELINPPIVAASSVAGSTDELKIVKPEDEAAQLGLQFGAFASSGAAANHLASFKLRYPLLFEGRSVIVRTKERNGVILYRTIMGPFNNYELASEFCIQLKEKREDCFVTEYNISAR